MILLRLLMVFIMSTYAFVAYARDTYIVDCNSTLSIRSAPDSSAPVVGSLSNGTKIYVEAFDGDWAEIKYNNNKAYIAAKYIKESEITAARRAGIRPGPGQHFSPVKKSDFSWQLSTNRIMERLPDFGILRGKVGNPDIWFWMAMGLFAIVFAINWFANETYKFKTDKFFWSVLLCFTLASICELVYILSSEEPISFFSPDINTMGTAIFNFLALIILTQAQFSIMVKLLNSIEYRSSRNFMASWGSFFIWGAIIGMIGYFVTLVFENKPEWWWWLATGILYTVPIIAMLVSSCAGSDLRPLLLGIPLYIIGSIPLIFMMSIIAVALIFIVITYLMIRTALFFIGEGTLVKENLTGQIYYIFPDGSRSLFDRHVW